MSTKETCRAFSFELLFLVEMQLLPCVKWPPGVRRMLLFLLISPVHWKYVYTLCPSLETFLNLLHEQPYLLTLLVQ